jgi:hypothetical protein
VSPNFSQTTSLLPGAPQGPIEAGGTAPAPAAPPRRGLRPVLVVAGAALAVAGAIVGFVLLNPAGGGDATGSAVTPGVHRTAGTSAPTTASRTALPALVSGRNPFVLPSGAAAGTGTATSASDAATGTADSANGTAPAAGSTPTPTPTATPTFVGLYGFTGSNATFWVNDTRYQVSEGSSFAGFTYTSKSSSGCANVTRSGTTTAICAGEVKRF